MIGYVQNDNAHEALLLIKEFLIEDSEKSGDNTDVFMDSVSMVSIDLLDLFFHYSCYLWFYYL